MSPQLRPPVGPDDHARGPENAPVTLVEYGDFECPYCQMAHPIVQHVRRRMRDVLRVVYRHFPLTEIHPHAQVAAESSEAAAVRGRFWPMHDMLFEARGALDETHILGYVAQLGLDPASVARDLRAHVFEARVREHFLSGVRSGVNGTPTFFINGVRHDGPWDEESLLDALEQAAHAHA